MTAGESSVLSEGGILGSDSGTPSGLAHTLLRAVPIALAGQGLEQCDSRHLGGFGWGPSLWRRGAREPAGLGLACASQDARLFCLLVPMSGGPSSALLKSVHDTLRLSIHSNRQKSPGGPKRGRGRNQARFTRRGGSQGVLAAASLPLACLSPTAPAAFLRTGGSSPDTSWVPQGVPWWQTPFPLRELTRNCSRS